MEGRGGIKILSTALLAGTCPLCHNSDAIDEISSLRKAVDIIKRPGGGFILDCVRLSSFFPVQMCFCKWLLKILLSRLDYCNAVPAATLASLQRVLHAAARLVLNLKPRDHVTPALWELHWLPVVQ